MTDFVLRVNGEPANVMDFWGKTYTIGKGEEFDINKIQLDKKLYKMGEDIMEITGSPEEFLKKFGSKHPFRYE